MHGPWPILCLANCSQHAERICPGVSCAGFAPLGRKWACTCCGKWWCDSLTLKSVAAEQCLLLLVCCLLFVVALVFTRISFRDEQCVVGAVGFSRACCLSGCCWFGCQSCWLFESAAHKVAFHGVPFQAVLCRGEPSRVVREIVFCLCEFWLARGVK